MLLNFPQCPSILLLQTSKTGNNALDIITSNLEKHLNGQQVLKQMKKCQAFVNKNFDRSFEVYIFFLLLSFARILISECKRTAQGFNPQRKEKKLLFF
jgi:hypothetical protein